MSISRIIINQDLDKTEIFKLLENNMKIGQIILLDGVFFKRVKRFEDENPIFIKARNYDDTNYIELRKNADKDIIKYTSFSKLESALNYIKRHLNDNYKYELEKEGFVIYKSEGSIND